MALNFLNNGIFTGAVTAPSFTGDLTATSILINGVTAFTQSANDNSTKVATTAYVDGAAGVTSINTGGGLDGGPITGSGTIEVEYDAVSTNVLQSGFDYRNSTIVSGDYVMVSHPSNTGTYRRIGYTKVSNLLAAGSSGTLTGITEGPGITVTASATSPTVAVDYIGADSLVMEAADAVPDLDDYIIFGADSSGGGDTNKIQFTDVNLSLFNNDSGFTSNAGTVTSVGSGAGLTGGPFTVSGNIAVDYLGTDSIIKAAPTISTAVALTDFLLVAGSNGNVYETTFSNLPFAPATGGSYLPLTGGTLSGPGNLTIQGTLTGTTASFNSGATNVVASFTSTDGIAGIKLQDSGGNVELSASGNTFQVQPAGGVAALSVTSTAATFAGSLDVNGAGNNTFTGNILIDNTAPIIQTNSSNNASGFRINVTGIADSTNNLFRVQRSGTTMIDTRGNGNTTFTAQAFSAATSSGDGSSTLTTKGYVDSLITGATIYRGTWDPDVSLNSGYGNPNLNTVTQTSGYYYICSADGTATPNGTGNEPDSWNTGDWVIWNDDIGTGEWQKIDNSSVLSGVGTGQTVALWQGASSVTDSETLGNAPITVSGNNATFAGDVTIGGKTYPKLNLTDNQGVPRNFSVGTNNETFTVRNETASSDAFTISNANNATFAGGITVSSPGASFYTTFKSANDYVIGLKDSANTTQWWLKAYTNGGFALHEDNVGDKFTIAAGGNATFAGTVTATTFLGNSTTQTAGDNSTKIATTAYADAAAAAVPIGNYLPLSAGSSYPLTGILYLGNVASDQKIQFQRTGGNVYSIEHDSAQLYFYNRTTTESPLIIQNDGDVLMNAGNVGIGTTGPNYKLSVSGGIEAGGLITYSKVAGSLSTTGYAVAGLTAGFNGASAGFEFKCYGSNSKYQRIVYSCHCSGTTWVPGKVIDEGTNDLDVVASANGATITFTFKARSSTQNFSPRIVIQATGHSINSTYA